ncbi:MAG: RNA polymerase sigma factor [Pirellulales bacterium]
MDETSASLLDRLRLQPDGDAWTRLVELYTPLIRGWLVRHGLPPQECDDVVQDVLQIVVRRVPEFRRQRTGSFRTWLRAIAVNCLRDFWKTRHGEPAASGNSEFAQMLEQLADPNSGLSQQWDQEHDRHVSQKLLETIRPAFEARTWQAFQRVAIDGASADQTAAELGISVNAVFIAKSRVLNRLRQEAQGLVD